MAELPYPPSVSPYLSVALEGTKPYPASSLYVYVVPPQVVWFTTFFVAAVEAATRGNADINRENFMASLGF